MTIKLLNIINPNHKNIIIVTAFTYFNNNVDIRIRGHVVNSVLLLSFWFILIINSFTGDCGRMSRKICFDARVPRSILEGSQRIFALLASGL